MWFYLCIQSARGEHWQPHKLWVSLSLDIKLGSQDSWELWFGAYGSFLWLLHDLSRAGLVDGKTDEGEGLGF